MLSYQFFLPSVAYAQLGSDVETEIHNLENQTSANQADPLPKFVQGVSNIAVPLAVASLIILFMYAGFLMVTSQGNPEKLKEAREVISNAIVGFILITLATTILLVITNALNIPIP